MFFSFSLWPRLVNVSKPGLVWLWLANVSGPGLLFAVNCFSLPWPRLVLLDCRVPWDMLKSWNQSRDNACSSVRGKLRGAGRAAPERRVGSWWFPPKARSLQQTVHSVQRGFFEASIASPRAFCSGSGWTVFLLVRAGDMAGWFKLGLKRERGHC